MLKFGKIGGAVAIGVMLALSLLVPGAFARSLENAHTNSSVHTVITTRAAHPLHSMHQKVQRDDGEGDEGDGSDGADGGDGGDGF